MLTNSLDLPTKQLRHLVAIQPHSLILKPHIQPDRLVRLVDDNLVFTRVYLSTRFWFHCIVHSMS